MTGRGNSARAGFTLVEVLVALTLLGLISVALFSGLRFGARAWERGGERLDGLHEVVAVRAFLRRSVAEGLDARQSRAPARDGWAGGPARFEFLTPAPQAIHPPGAIRLTLAAEEDGAGRVRLIISWRPDRPKHDDEAHRGGVDDRRRVLLSDLAAVRFGYLGQGRDGAPEWRETWEPGDGTPWLVAVELAFPAGDRRRWPRLAVAPRAASPPAGRSLRLADGRPEPR